MLLSTILNTITLTLSVIGALWQHKSKDFSSVLRGQWWAASITIRRIAGVKTATGPCRILPDWYTDTQSTCGEAVLPTNAPQFASRPLSHLEFIILTHPTCAARAFPSPTPLATTATTALSVPTLSLRPVLVNETTARPMLDPPQGHHHRTVTVGLGDSFASQLGDGLKLQIGITAGIVFIMVCYYLSTLDRICRSAVARVQLAWLHITVGRHAGVNFVAIRPRVIDEATQPTANLVAQGTAQADPARTFMVQVKAPASVDLGVLVGIPRTMAQAEITTHALLLPPSPVLAQGAFPFDPPPFPAAPVLPAEVLPPLNLPAPLDAEDILAGLVWEEDAGPALAAVGPVGIEDEETSDSGAEDSPNDTAVDGEMPLAVEVTQARDARQATRITTFYRSVHAPSPPVPAPSLGPSISESALWAAPPTPPPLRRLNTA
ncbi:hypothetical protein B0H16DRAFT_55376 [Mycena metata]|uniref:Uncharacterized protein n=1 Tax=Mycena metata TaxID=1033252 RepID=A0AAD7N0L8_9AGAR|nr:hypothetical protein B0H16DRAFT_55376 [Mycena metata]